MERITNKQQYLCSKIKKKTCIDMIVKNKTTESIFINKCVQIDVNTPDPNDGYILPSQSLDLSKSLSDSEIMDNLSLSHCIHAGELVFVVDGLELEQGESIEIYDAGPAYWATTFNSVVSKFNLREGLALGFLYVKNCLIG